MVVELCYNLRTCGVVAYPTSPNHEPIYRGYTAMAKSKPTSGKRESPARLNLAGMRYSRWTVIQEDEPLEYISRNRREYARKWLCRCDCGTEAVVYQTNLNRGKSKSCGCLQNEAVVKHGYSRGHKGHKLHRRWIAMRQRCYSADHKEYKNYGARGITVCDEWNNSAAAFIDWGLKNGWREGLSIDRVDNNSGYSPSNCRFTDIKTQSNNTRRNVLVTIDGQTYTFIQACEKFGVSERCARGRKWRGWPLEKIFSTPVARHRRSLLGTDMGE